MSHSEGQNEILKSDGRAHAYVSKRTVREEVKSTAYAFTVMSVIGFLFLILFAAGVLPLNTAFYMKVLICIVMGIMFAAFFFIGVRSFAELKALESAVNREEQKLSEIREWFLGTYDAAACDAKTDKTLSAEQLYFQRCETMGRLIRSEYPETEEAFLDHVIDTLYDEIFSA